MRLRVGRSALVMWVGLVVGVACSAPPGGSAPPTATLVVVASTATGAPAPSATSAPTATSALLNLPRATLAPATVAPSTATPGQAVGAATVTPAQAVATPTAPVSLAFVSVVGGRPGGRARVTVQTPPGASCSIRYTTPAGNPSTAQGLVPAVADATGRIAWSWVIGTGTRPGTGQVTVTCGGSTITAPIQIG